MHILGELIVVRGYKRRHRLFHALHLHERHLAVLLKELERLDDSVRGEQVAHFLLAHRRRYVGQVKSGRGRENVVEVLRAGLLETMQRRIAEVLGEARVGRAFFGHLHGQMFGRKDADLLVPELAPVQMGLGGSGLLRVREVD